MRGPPGVEYQAGALVFPRLVPIRPDHPGAYDNRKAREKLAEMDIPVLLLAGAEDQVTRGWEQDLGAIFRSVARLAPIANAGHFIQEDRGEEVAWRILRWMADSAL